MLASHHTTGLDPRLPCSPFLPTTSIMSSSSFANASNFRISNSTFTHIAGNQHNYNFEGEVSEASCDAMARFVFAVENVPYKKNNHLSKGPQKERPNIHTQHQGSSFEDTRCFPQPSQPSIQQSLRPPPALTYHQTNNDIGTQPITRPGPPGAPSHLAFPDMPSPAPVQQVYGNQCVPFQTGSTPSYYCHSRALAGPSIEAPPSSWNSASRAVGSPPALVPLPTRPPVPPCTFSTENRRGPDGAGAPAQTPLPPATFDHSSHELWMMNINSQPRVQGFQDTTYDQRRDMNGDTRLYPVWLEDGRMVQTPSPNQRQHYTSRHPPHNSVPYRHYHTYPPPDHYYPHHIEAQAQFRRDSYNMLLQHQPRAQVEAHDDDESNPLMAVHPTFQNYEFESRLHWTPSAPYTCVRPMYGGPTAPINEDTRTNMQSSMDETGCYQVVTASATSHQSGAAV